MTRMDEQIAAIVAAHPATRWDRLEAAWARESDQPRFAKLREERQATGLPPIWTAETEAYADQHVPAYPPWRWQDRLIVGAICVIGAGMMLTALWLAWLLVTR